AVDLAGAPAMLAMGSVARFSARAVAGLLRLSVDNPKAADPKVDVTPVPGAHLDIALIPPAGQSRISLDLGVARLEAARLVGAVSWERGHDPVPSVDLVDPAIVLQAGALRLDLSDMVTGLALPAGTLPSLRFAGISGITGLGIGAFNGSGVSLSGLTLPNFGTINFSLPDLGLGAGGQWFVELGNFVLGLVTVGLPNWALGGSAGAWRGWSLGIMQLLGGWPNFDLGEAGGVAVPWPSGFDLDLAGFARFLRNPFDGLRLRLGKLFTVPGGGIAGMSLLWRWLRGQMPDIDGSLPSASVPAVTGKGTYADPWAIKINDSNDFPVELISWVDPAGPPGVAGASTPTHVGFGLRLDLAPDPIVGPLELDTYARADLFTIDVTPLTGASGAARPTPALALEAQIRHENPSGWLLDQDSSAVRLRALKLGLHWSPDTGVVPSFELVDAGYQPGIAGPASTGDLVGLVALSTGGVLLDRLAAPGGPLADNSMRPLMVILESIGVAAANSPSGYHFLAVPMQRLLTDAPAYLRERFWDNATNLPRLRPLQPALVALGFTISPDANDWWAAAPLGDRILRLEESGTLHLVWGAALPAGALELGLDVTFNPFSGRTDGRFSMACGAADLRLLMQWQDFDGYGGTPAALAVSLVPTENSEMARAFGGPLQLWPAADPAALGVRVLTIGYRLAVEFAVSALFDALVLPHLSSAAKGNLIAFGVLEGTVASPHPAPLWMLFEDPVGRILERLHTLRGDFAITSEFELHADDQRIALRTKNGAAINLGSSGAQLALSLGVLTAPAANWAPELQTTFNYTVDGKVITVEAGFAGNRPQLTVCGLQLLPSFAGFAGSGLSIQGATLNALLPAAITGTLIGLDSISDPAAQQIVSKLELLMDAGSPTVSVKFNAVKTFINDLAALITSPSLDFFTDARIKALLATLEAGLGAVTGVTATRLADGNDSANSNGTRTKVAINGVPAAVIVGRWQGQLGLWMVKNGSLGLGYVDIDDASKIGAYVTGSGSVVTPGATCMLILTGSVPAPFNLDPALRVDLDTGGRTSLTLYFVGGSTESDTSDDIALQLLPSINFAMG
ncbi:MAG: hypothetical protein KC431_21945, partial [Myxococcales bacterium]|nr:hypothetical protein [Myxococcales bacterium]